MSPSASGSWLENPQHPAYTNRWFSSLSKNHQSALLEAGRQVRLNDAELFAEQNELVHPRKDGFALLLDGLIKLSSTTHDGRESILGYIHPGQWFGELALIDGASR